MFLSTDKANEIIDKSTEGKAIFDLSKVSGTNAVDLPKSALAAFDDAGLDVMIKLPAGTITLDNEAAASIIEQTTVSRLDIELKQVTVDSLNSTQKEAVKSSDIVLDINLVSNGKKITSFDGKLTVSVPYDGPKPVAVWYLNDEGELEKLNCTFVNGMVSFDLDHLSVYVVGQDSYTYVNPFVDVNKGIWFYDSVRYVYENALMVGTSTDPMLFSPHDSTMRAMLMTILYRLEGSPKVSSVNPFNDVASDKYYTNAVIWAAENKIISGYGNGKFGPEDYITREQMAMILMNYAKFKGYDVSARANLSDYTDAINLTASGKEAMAWANAKGLIVGNNSILDPTGNAERCQVAAILQRFIESEK